MIISRTPYRISFFGGGTDYPEWYRENGGAVLGTTINKYCYITCRYLPPFFDHRIRIQYARTEQCNAVDEIAHPAVREALRFLSFERGVEIHHDGDLPARSGMGSSSAFTVGLLHALHALEGRMAGKTRLAREAIHVEQEMIRETVGSQDQVLTAHGGFNTVRFDKSGEIVVSPVTVPPHVIHELCSNLMLFFTGRPRTASDVARSYVGNLKGKERQLTAMEGMVWEALDLLGGGRDLASFGKLLHEAWELKNTMGRRISNAAIREIYQEARRAGAVGGKVLGAGGGGFMLLFVPPRRQATVRKRLGRLLSVPFNFEYHGSQIIFHGEEEDFSSHDERPGKRAGAKGSASLKSAPGTRSDPAGVNAEPRRLGLEKGKTDE